MSLAPRGKVPLLHLSATFCVLKGTLLVRTQGLDCIGFPILCKSEGGHCCCGGLGGTRDATNVITPARLAAAVITNIGKEHLAALGRSLESIALAKSGIIKQGRPVVLGGPLDPTIEKIICGVAAAKSSRVIRAFGEGMQYNVSNVTLADGGTFQCCDLSINLVLLSGSSPTWKLDKKSLQLRMMGCHQLDNALTAICTILCLRHQGWQVEENAIWSGLEQTFATGRFQVMSQAESVKVGCEQATLVLDGAHTASSANALARTLEMVFPSAALALVVAMASDKDHLEFGSQVLSDTMLVSWCKFNFSRNELPNNYEDDTIICAFCQGGV